MKSSVKEQRKSLNSSQKWKEHVGVAEGQLCVPVESGLGKAQPLVTESVDHAGLEELFSVGKIVARYLWNQLLKSKVCCEEIHFVSPLPFAKW